MSLIDRALDRWGRRGNLATTILVAVAKQLRRDPAIRAATARGRADALADTKAGRMGATHDGTDDGMTADEAEAYSRAYIKAAPKEWGLGRPGRLVRRRR